LLYGACFALFAVAVSRGGRSRSRRVVLSLLVAGVLVSLLALDEVFLGIGPQWADRAGAAATLGNANFLAAWSGIVLVLAVGVGLDTAEKQAWRITSTFAVLLLLTSMVLSASIQAWYVLAAGLAVLGLAVATDRLPRTVGRAMWSGVGAAAVAGAGATWMGALGRGPLAALSNQIGVQLRVEYWTAAGRMVADHTLLGVGPGRFAEYYREYRSPEAANLVSLHSNTDSAHSVPLHLFAEWGAIVAIAHLAVVALVTVALIRELGRRTGLERLRYGAVGAAWVGYVVQSLISIDTPVMVVLGWALAGLVVAPTVSDHWRMRLPWKPTTRRSGTPAVAWAGHAVVTVAVMAVIWLALVPYRASAASAGGEIEIDPTGSEQPAVTWRASEIAPWEDRYWLRLAETVAGEGYAELAPSVLDEALRVGGRRFDVQLTAARLHLGLEQTERAREHFERAIELEPWHPDLYVEAAEFALEQGETDWAQELLTHALRVDPGHAGALGLQAAA
jgi:hypothetical protein